MRPPPIELSAVSAAGATFAGVPVAAVRLVLANGNVLRLRLAATAHPGVVTAVTGAPAEGRPEPFCATECSRDLLGVLRASDGPLVLSAILARLESRNQLHGESTVKRALAAMVRAGVLANPGHRVGYSIAGVGQSE
ncbi:hypothetical protein [Limnoglobus roseus]|uniref:Uncharacterized protein n=1 Tax=Limnoglobus roseus TaxID=2598579 RepID=A0A5C1ARS1_9BACT|nr:hypothetical protein [Limnoglobus roseus]QEL18847.1 hypothetical protein PX52LOC_05888 [Limnoglobus roseus]QEL20412.1 hypothetical protein PX52LOC_07506 [Limnoglobus roseus]